jgi:type IV pilus assembly protein PilY1
MRKRTFISGIISLIIIITIVVFISLQAGSAPSLNDYTAYPPFISQAVPPNVLILLDNSGSMYEFAYKTAETGGKSSNPDMSYSSATDYYGYFDYNALYKYHDAGGYFEVDTSKALNRMSFWSGNFLNWLTMRRVDVVRKVLMGGKATNRASVNPRFLLAAENTDKDYWKKHETQLYKVYSASGAARIQTCSDSSCTTGTSYNVKIFAGYQDPVGIIQKTFEKVRYGLMFFNAGNKYEDGLNRDGSYVSVDIGSEVTNLVTQIENTNPSTWTPLGEALYESIRYFEAITSAYNGGATYSGKDPIQYWCQKNFVLIITDGESSKDINLPGTFWTGKTDPVTDTHGFNIGAYMDRIASNEGYSTQWNTDANTDNGTYYLEGVAYYAHITDLRSSSVGKSDIEGLQNLSIYSVYAFDESPVSKNLLKKTAKYGAFVDRNENNKPDLEAEWDADGNNIPDTYFEASKGEELEASLLNALASILNRTSSGTAASVLSTTGEGEGAIYQAYFYPKKFEGSEERTWLGYIHALFIDPYGNPREDTDRDGKLSLEKDYIVQIQYDLSEGTFVRRYRDSDGNGKYEEAEFVDKISLDNIHSIWNGAMSLWEMSQEDRKIYTTINGYELERFERGARNSLRPHIRASDDNEAEAIIQYIRGEDNPTVETTTYKYRPRTITIGSQKKVWKLGDIVYSTPTIVSRPMENYDLIYGDQTYYKFRQKYFNRRHVIYVGANDGMLHAFNGGFYDTKEHKFSGGRHRLGDELWAFIPRELLPHLIWLTKQDYTHVYYVDLKPKVTDVKIFEDDDTHPGGWGTILIAGMRYGGKTISTEKGNYRSTYFALDITDPEQEPKLLWTFDTTDSGVTDLGLSMSYPAVAKVADEWYIIFGSGPTNFDQLSNLTEFQKGKIFVLKTSGRKGVIDRWIENTNFWKVDKTIDGKQFLDAFMASPLTIDVNVDYNVDVSYIGVNYKLGGKETSMLRLTTQGTKEVGSWKLSELYAVIGFDLSKRITVSPSAVLDKKGQLWIYFGTGHFLGVDDRNQTDSGSFYGIKEGCWDGNREGCPKKYTNLLDVTNTAVYFGGEKIEGLSAGVGDWSQLLSTIASKDGWAIYFENMYETYDHLSDPTRLLQHKGERVTIKPAIFAGFVMFSTYIPGSDVCTTEGDSNLYVLYYVTGTAYKAYAFKAEKIKKPEKVSRATYLGKGLPSSIGLAVTKEGQIKGFVQSSTEKIQSIQELDPSAPRSGYTGWKVGKIR